MDFAPSPRAREYAERVAAFVGTEIAPRERACLDALRDRPGRWAVPPPVEELKAKARERGLWNLFLPDPRHGAGPSVTEYAPPAEPMGRSPIAPEVFNRDAPDTGNAEVLLHHGSDEQRERWPEPLPAGRIRSAFRMTEPDVASSDAANMAATAVLDGDEVVLGGRTWWSTGIGRPHCRFAVLMGLADPGADRHRRHSMVLVPLDAPGVRIERMLPGGRA